MKFSSAVALAKFLVYIGKNTIHLLQLVMKHEKYIIDFYNTSVIFILIIISVLNAFLKGLRPCNMLFIHSIPSSFSSVYILPTTRLSSKEFKK